MNLPWALAAIKNTIDSRRVYPVYASASLRENWLPAPPENYDTAQYVIDGGSSMSIINCFQSCHCVRTGLPCAGLNIMYKLRYGKMINKALRAISDKAGYMYIQIESRDAGVYALPFLIASVSCETTFSMDTPLQRYFRI